jgi:hypothetical protein
MISRDRRGLFLIAMLLAAKPLYSQSAIVGVVRDSIGAPVSGATVSIPALNRAIQTDANGAFELTNVAPGMRMLSVRRIGFAPFTKLTSVAEGRNAIQPIILARLITKLDTVVTEEQLAWREDPSLREMADNMKIGLGKFVLRPELEKLTGLQVSRVFNQRGGALKVVTDASGHAWLASGRVRSLQHECFTLEDQFGRTTPDKAGCLFDCFPKVYLDNQPLSVRPKDVPEINRYLPENLEAIEIYTSGAQTPPRYATLETQCGVVILHSRKGYHKVGK